MKRMAAEVSSLMSSLALLSNRYMNKSNRRVHMLPSASASHYIVMRDLLVIYSFHQWKEIWYWTAWVCVLTMPQMIQSVKRLQILHFHVLINKYSITSPCDLNNDKEVPFGLHYQLPLSHAPCIWDPGIDLFSYKRLHLVPWFHVPLYIISSCWS
jgi:hypothetical protein